MSEWLHDSFKHKRHSLVAIYWRNNVTDGKSNQWKNLLSARFQKILVIETKISKFAVHVKDTFRRMEEYPYSYKRSIVLTLQYSPFTPLITKHSWTLGLYIRITTFLTKRQHCMSKLTHWKQIMTVTLKQKSTLFFQHSLAIIHQGVQRWHPFHPHLQPKALNTTWRSSQIHQAISVPLRWISNHSIIIVILSKSWTRCCKV